MFAALLAAVSSSDFTTKAIAYFANSWNWTG